MRFSSPLFSSYPGLTHHEWLSEWSCHLISKVKRSKRAEKLLNACKAAIKRDFACAQFMLPYILSECQ